MTRRYLRHACLFFSTLHICLHSGSLWCYQPCGALMLPPPPSHPLPYCVGPDRSSHLYLYNHVITASTLHAHSGGNEMDPYTSTRTLFFFLAGNRFYFLLFSPEFQLPLSNAPPTRTRRCVFLYDQITRCGLKNKNKNKIKIIALLFSPFQIVTPPLVLL